MARRWPPLPPPRLARPCSGAARPDPARPASPRYRAPGRAAASQHPPRFRQRRGATWRRLRGGREGAGRGWMPRPRAAVALAPLRSAPLRAPLGCGGSGRGSPADDSRNFGVFLCLTKGPSAIRQ